MRIVFYGTPEFAVASLKKIIENNFNVVAVVTSPDKQAGRGMQISHSAIKKFALSHNLKILQPENLKSDDFLNELKELKPDLQIVIAFRMMPEAVWNFPPLGTFNLHASLLPQYRGAAPINRAIMNGEKETGVTTFFLKHEIDTGNIILQEKVIIDDTDDAGTLHDKLMNLGADLVLNTLKKIEKNDIKTFIQTISNNDKSAPKIFKTDCLIKTNQNVLNIFNQVRGLSPYPGAFIYFNNKILKIFKGTYILGNSEQTQEFEIIDNKKLRIRANDGWYLPEIVQPEGKRKMNIEDFINGLK